MPSLNSALQRTSARSHVCLLSGSSRRAEAAELGTLAGLKRTLPMERRNDMLRKWLSRVLLVGAGAGAVLVSLWLDRFLAGGHQISNMERARACVRQIDAYKTTHGRFPARLADAVEPRLNLDQWEHPFAYRSDGKKFILVSFGRDGSPDRDVYDYWRSRNAAFTVYEAPEYVWSICGRPNADQIMSDLGEHRICGK